MDLYVVYEVKYGGTKWYERATKPVAVFECAKTARKYARDRELKAKEYCFSVTKLKLM
jgi:hypothetical protein